MENKNNQEKKKYSLIPLIILAVIAGFIAGITGEIIVRTYFMPDYTTSYFTSEYNLGDLNNRSNLIIRDAKKVVVNQDVKVEETIGSIQPALLRVFKRITPESDLSQDLSTSSLELLDLSEEEALYYNLDEPDFIALIITSDGWATASLSPGLVEDFNISDYVAIDNNRRLYDLDELSDFENLPGNLIFFHLDGASNLPIKALASRSNISLGQSVLTISDFNNVSLTSVSAIKFPGGILSSDALNIRLSLAGNLGNDFLNSFVFNLAGDLVAIIGSDKELIPAFSYTHYWQSFFQDKVFSPPYFGVNYLDLSRTKVVGLDREKGVLLQGSDERAAVIKGSPADQAGLLTGDIITWINNQELDYNHDLSSVISSYNPEEEISIIYIRGEEEYRVKVKLGARD